MHGEANFFLAEFKKAIPLECEKEMVSRAVVSKRKREGEVKKRKDDV